MIHTVVSLLLILSGYWGIINLDEAMYGLAVVTVATASLFYWLMFNVIASLKVIGLNPDMDVPMSIAIKIVEWLTIYVLYTHGFVFAAFFIMPWVLITTFSDFFAMLIKFEIIEIAELDPDPDEEDR